MEGVPEMIHDVQVERRFDGASLSFTTHKVGDFPMRAALFLILSALPAAAHQGAHIHPHGGESWIAVAMGLVVIGAAGALGRRASVRRKPRK